MRAEPKRTTFLSATVSLVLATAGLGAVTLPGPAAAQSVPWNGGVCPPGFQRGVYGNGAYNDPGRCYDRRSDAARSVFNVAKPHRLDRCPLGFFTSDADPMMCATRVANPPTIRVRGNAPCRRGEVEDWGLWCVSNYAGLTRSEAATAQRDWNAIYTLNRGTPPHQADLPEGEAYSPAYLVIFGPVQPDGSPMGAGGPARPMSFASASGARVGALSPQRQTSASPFCPSGWMDGTNPNTGARDPGVCFPMPNLAQPAYPRSSPDETCAPGYVLNGTWCGRDPSAPGATVETQVPPNCPPAGGGTAREAGAAIGGLLGARRGNAQSGAALGGLLGQAAGGSQRPAGCP